LKVHVVYPRKYLLCSSSGSDVKREARRQALREDQEDLAAVRLRAREKAHDHEAFLGKLKADGSL